MAAAAVPILTDIGGGGARAAMHPRTSSRTRARCAPRSRRCARAWTARSRSPRCRGRWRRRPACGHRPRARELASRCTYAPGMPSVRTANRAGTCRRGGGRSPRPKLIAALRARPRAALRRAARTPEVRARLDYELGVVSRKGSFASYILTVAAICRRAAHLRARLRSVLAHLLPARHHQRRPGALPPGVRALPLRRAPRSPGHRCRLPAVGRTRSTRARRGDRGITGARARGHGSPPTRPCARTARCARRAVRWGARARTSPTPRSA